MQKLLRDFKTESLRFEVFRSEATLHGPQAVEITVVTVENALQLVKKGSFHLPPIDPAVEAIMRDWRQPWRTPWT